MGSYGKRKQQTTEDKVDHPVTEMEKKPIHPPFKVFSSIDPIFEVLLSNIGLTCMFDT